MEDTVVYKLNRALNRIFKVPSYDKSIPIFPVLKSWYQKTWLEVELERAGNLQKRKLRSFGKEVDFEVIRVWQRQCHKFHGMCCNDRYSDDLAKYMKQIQLVDVVRGCLVTMSSSTPYVALSYVWGNITMLKATKANVDQLRQEGALFENSVAATVRDAMHVVQRLEERYLWVDCLCIVQDADADEMNNMLQAMGRIYASAEFTIVAASGDDASFGISGVGGLARERDKSFLLRAPSDLGLNLDHRKEQSAWLNRGWTFQESLFSRRLLVFDTIVTWMCGRVVQHECFENIMPPGVVEVNENTAWPSERPHLGFPMGMMSLIPKLPSLGRWGMLVEDYSSRKLTYSQDATRAFAGATEIMASTFPGGILHGLPLFFFDIAMLWTPSSYTYPEYDTAQRTEGPSWSWTGWKAEAKITCLERWHPHLAGIYRATGESSDWVTIAPLRPVAAYQVLPASDDTSYSLEINDFYVCQALRDDPDGCVVPGWERHGHVDGHYYTQQNLGGSDQRLPFPFPTADEYHSPLPADIGPILLCTAPLVDAWFEALPEEERTSNRDLITDRAPLHARFLVYTENASAEFYLANKMRFTMEPFARCTLVAISEVEVRNLEGLINGRDRFDSCYHYLRYAAETGLYYNVLWVEWDGDVAYRKALGVISSQDWEALGPVCYTIKLG